jgi:hypothetical protein
MLCSTRIGKEKVMSLKSLAKRLKKALPVIVDSAPAVIAAADAIRKALKKPKKAPAETAS